MAENMVKQLFGSIGVLLLIGLVVSFIASSVDDTPKERFDPNNPDFKNIEYRLLNLTKVQGNEFKEGLMGKKVTWSGWVEDVKESWFSEDYSVEVNMEGPTSNLSGQVDFKINPEIGKRLGKGTYITFEGKITRASIIIGDLHVTLNEVKIR